MPWPNSLTADFLHGRGRFAPDAPFAPQLPWLLLFVLVFGTIYGIVMGTFSGLEPGRFHQLLYSGLKVPMLLLVTFLICLPSFFVLNSAVGLRSDFPQALRAVLAAQACVTLVLASLAPITALFYFSCSDYTLALLFNGFVFAVASFTAQIIIRRNYRPLIQRSSRHLLMLRMWLFFYVFVGVQMGWALRPFIGDPDQTVSFFRKEAWGNAYVVIASLFSYFFHGFSR